MILPRELIHIILEYAGRVKNRNGKIIYQLNIICDNKFNLVKENIINKSIIINEVKFNDYNMFCKYNIIESKITTMYPKNYFSRYVRDIIFNTIHELIPPYKSILFSHHNPYI